MANLSQDEIDALFSNLGGPETAPAPPASAATASPAVGPAAQPVPLHQALQIPRIAAPPPPPRNCRLYDFRRPEKLSKDQARLLRSHFGLLSRKISNYLANLSRSSADVSLLETDQTTYGEIFGSHSTPTLFATFTQGREGGHGLLRLNLMQVYGLVDRLMGGSGSCSLRPRPLTDFERSLMNEVCGKLLSLYAEAAQEAEETPPSVTLLETDERLIPRALPPDEIMVRSVYDLRLGPTTGYLHFYVPLSSASRRFAPMRGRIGPWSLPTRERRLPPSLRSFPLPVTVELGSCRATAGEVASLQPGDVLQLDQLEAEPLRVRVGGVLRFAGRPGLLGKKMAVRIVEQIKEDGTT